MTAAAPHMNNNMNILLVEDSRADARLIQILLGNTDAPLNIEHVEIDSMAVPPGSEWFHG